MKVTTALDQCIVEGDTRLCTRTARRRTATRRRARPAAFAKSCGGNQRRGASRVGNSATVASPGPAPKTIIALSSGWLAIRPRWIVHKCYSGPWRPRRGRHIAPTKTRPGLGRPHPRRRCRLKRQAAGPLPAACFSARPRNGQAARTANAIPA